MHAVLWAQACGRLAGRLAARRGTGGGGRYHGLCLWGRAGRMRAIPRRVAFCSAWTLVRQVCQRAWAGRAGGAGRAAGGRRRRNAHSLPRAMLQRPPAASPVTPGAHCLCCRLRFLRRRGLHCGAVTATLRAELCWRMLRLPAATVNSACGVHFDGICGHLRHFKQAAGRRAWAGGLGTWMEHLPADGTLGCMHAFCLNGSPACAGLHGTRVDDFSPVPPPAPPALPFSTYHRSLLPFAPAITVRCALAFGTLTIACS